MIAYILIYFYQIIVRSNLFKIQWSLCSILIINLETALKMKQAIPLHTVRNICAQPKQNLCNNFILEK